MEVTIGSEISLISIDNIAMIKRVNEFVTEFSLLTKDKNNSQITFQVYKNYADFRLILNNENRLAFDFTINAH